MLNTLKKTRFIILLLGLFFLVTYCKKQKNPPQKAPQNKTPQNETKSPLINKSIASNNLTLLDKATGDLNNDKIPEKVMIYDNGNSTDFGTEREIHILKKVNTKWILWKKSIGPILPSEHGGMMGDPFERISIEKNCIVIYHSGGSRQKWSYTHKYRYQNNTWQLIGATTQFGIPCDYFETSTYNPSTGNIDYKIELENCEKESTKIEEKKLFKKLEILPLMDGFYPGNNELKFSNSKVTIFY